MLAGPCGSDGEQGPKRDDEPDLDGLRVMIEQVIASRANDVHAFDGREVEPLQNRNESLVRKDWSDSLMRRVSESLWAPSLPVGEGLLADTAEANAGPSVDWFSRLFTAGFAVIFLLLLIPAWGKL